MLVIHIGTHKTGTSALQAILSQGTAQHRALGLRYVDAGREGHLAHHLLAWSIRGRRGTKLGVWDGVRAELAESRAPINVLSSEGFWFEDPAEIKKQLAYDGEVRIVAYLRRQDKFLQSLYKQTVSSGRKTDFPAWMQEMSHRGDYLSVVRRWADAFGRGTIVLRPYERGGHTIDAVRDFFEVLGVDADAALAGIKSGAYNPSPRRELLNYLRAFNQLNLAVDYEKLFFSVIRRDKAYVRSADLLSPDECRALMAKYDAGNRTLSQEFWSGSEALIPDGAPGELPPQWDLGDPEFFKLTVDVFRAVVKLVAPEGPGTGTVRAKKKFAAKAP